MFIKMFYRSRFAETLDLTALTLLVLWMELGEGFAGQSISNDYNIVATRKGT